MKEKIIMVINNLINFLLSARAALLVWTGRFPDYVDARFVSHVLDSYGYGKEIDDLKSKFAARDAGDDESTRMDVDSVCVKDNAWIGNHSIAIRTRLAPDGVIGRLAGHYNDHGQWVHGLPLIKHAVSGLAISEPIFQPEGIYTASVTIDMNAIGSWDAWWFLRQVQPGETGRRKYGEVDMIERYFTRHNKPHKVQSAVHIGRSSQTDRRHYSHTYKLGTRGPVIPTVKKYRVAIDFDWKHGMRVFVNDLLVFVGLQWKPAGPLRMIVSSAVIKGGVNYLPSGYDYEFRVSNIRHYTKEQ